MTEIRPQSAQLPFLQTPADLAVYGGAAGGGKTWALLLECLRHVHLPGFRAVVFRRTTPEIRAGGGLWDASSAVFPHAGGVPREAVLEWRFPSGARVKFSHLQQERDRFAWQGAELPLICFDELTHFSERQFWFLLSRSRSLSGVKPYVRATCNPEATSWVKGLLAPWVERGHPLPAASGEARFFGREGASLRWSAAPFADSRSLVFVKASVYDNAALLAGTPEYVATLRALPYVERRRLLDGDWDVVEAGNTFRSEWFPVLPAAPPVERVVRFWDLAGSARGAGDFAAGVLLGRCVSGPCGWVVLDVARRQGTPGEVEGLVAATAGQDRAAWGGCSQGLEQEPGSSGVALVDHYVRRVLVGHHVVGVRSTGDKRSRALPVAAQCEAGNVALLAGAWNREFLTELAAFPGGGGHDDQVDALAGAFSLLAAERPVLLFGGGE